MTYEEKQLLIIDLCGRAPYGVRVKIRSCDIRTVRAVDVVEGIVHFAEPDTISPFGLHIEDPLSFRQKVKPYLRPMSSMTEEEKAELQKEHLKDEKLFIECINKSKAGDNSMRGKVITHFAADWCNKNHFDYRGLIDLNLALPAPENMYK